uniref:Uncharacterized protein n=1 Tax=Anguilla anguilla TaxID=7936 RepID=A0A0E9T1P1_ANGAN
MGSNVQKQGERLQLTHNLLQVCQNRAVRWQLSCARYNLVIESTMTR